MKFFSRVLPFVAAFTPALALAQQFGEIDTFFQDIAQFINSTLVPLVFAIAFLFFLWGVFQTFIMGSGDETKRETGKQYMLWAIIAFVVMVSLWGIVNLISGGLPFGSQERLQNIPDAPYQQD